MFGFGKKQNVFMEYGLENLDREKALSFVDMTMKAGSTECFIKYRNKTGNDEIDAEFFSFLDLLSGYDKHAYYVKEARRKLSENQSSGLNNLPDLAIAQLAALQLILTCMSGSDQSNPLKPTTKRALAEIDYYVGVARNIIDEAERVKAHEAAKSAASVQAYQDEQQLVRQKVKRIPHGEMSAEKVNALEALTHNDINILVYDSEEEFEDVEALVWIFSRPDCEIGNIMAFIEMWEVAEPCLSVTREEDHDSIRSCLFPVYEKIADGLNSLRFKKSGVPFTEANLKLLESMIGHQQELTASGKILMYPLNPQILFHYRQLVD